MRPNRLSTATLAASLVALAVAPAPGQPPEPVREITRIADEVYRFRNNLHYSIFAVTPVGIIVTDPINPDAARWLQAELARRFHQPLRYLIYSHDHADHIAGGQVFKEAGAVVVAHENARAQIVEERRPTAVPDITFTDRMTIELGGTTVELSYVGRNHSDNSIVMRFPQERVLFAVDFIPVEMVGFRDFPTSWIEDWIESLKRVEQMDFDILAPGHGQVGRKAHVAMFREYLEDLRREVVRLAREGKSLDEIKQLVRLPKYETWARYDEWFPLNVEGMYRQVQMHRRGN
jgi:glyoxylase-like metal-dependent hydrolase (beta-lactamase superfamily II)